ncbi:hypothetical protein ACP70R_035224 [Stipagrostis hirtigluma subsp. patula]
MLTPKGIIWHEAKAIYNGAIHHRWMILWVMTPSNKLQRELSISYVGSKLDAEQAPGSYHCKRKAQFSAGSDRLK